MRLRYVFIFAAIITLSGCNKSHVEDLEAQLADATSANLELTKKLDEAKSKASQVESDFEMLQSSSDNLKSATQKFGYEDWQSVVPDVTNSTNEVESATASLKSSIADTISALE